MPFKDKEAARQYAKEYYHKNKLRITENKNTEARKAQRSEYLAQYTKDNKDKIALQQALCYRRDKEAYKKRTQTRHKEHWRLVSDIKLHYCCMNETCGWTSRLYHPSVLEFHHCDAGQKEARVSYMLCKSKQAIAKEINKCVVLCANCHRLEHNTDTVVLRKRCTVTSELVVIENG